jgi:penicillin amidase
LENNHPFGEIKFLRPYFNVGPFPVDGTNEVLNNQIFDLTDNVMMNVKAGPSTRRVIDFSDVENAKAILPTGNSGNVMSKHYKDQAKLYVEGKFIPMLINEATIKKSKNKLVLQP